MEDFEVIDKVLAGETSLYRSLVEKYRSYVFSLTHKVLRNRTEAEEAAQETFIRAYHALKNFKKDAKFSSWLYRIAYNQAIQQIRKRKNHDSFEIERFETAHSDPSRAEESDRKRYVRLALDQLNEQDAVIVSLFYMQEMSIEEISSIVVLNQNLVKVRLHRARKKLAEILHGLLKEETLSL